MHGRILLSLLISLLVWSPATAAQLRPDAAPAAPAEEIWESADAEPALAAGAASAGRLVAGGVLGGALGGLLGALAGHFAGQSVDCFELACRDWVLAGAVAGESLGIPLAVHAANRRHGRLLPSLAASLALGAGGYALVSGVDLPDVVAGGIVVAVPIAQLLASIALARRAGE